MSAFHDEELVEIGGYRLILAIDFRTIDLAEYLAGMGMPEIMVSLSADRPPVGVMGQLLWALLRRHHQEMTLDQAAGLMFGEHRGSVLESMFALLKRAMNFDEKKSEGSEAKWSIETFLVEWVALGGSPTEFWRQTPRSFVCVMEGMAKAASKKVDLAILTAWHTAIFALNGYSGKLAGKKLSDFLTSEPKEHRSKYAEAIAFFNSLKARGVPIEITRH